MKKFLLVFLAMLGLTMAAHSQTSVGTSSEYSKRTLAAEPANDAADFDTTVLQTQWEYAYYSTGHQNHASSRFTSVLSGQGEIVVGGWQENIRQSTDTAKYDMVFARMDPSTGSSIGSIWNYYTRGITVYANLPGGLVRNGNGFIMAGSVEFTNNRKNAIANALGLSSVGAISVGKYYFINPTVNLHIDAIAPATDGAVVVGTKYVGNNSSIWLARLNTFCDTVWTKTFTLDATGNDIHPAGIMRCANGDYVIIYNGPATAGTYFERVDSNGVYISSRIWTETLWDETLVSVGENSDGTLTLIGTQNNNGEIFWFVDNTDATGTRLGRQVYGLGLARGMTADGNNWVVVYLPDTGPGHICSITKDGTQNWDYSLGNISMAPWAVARVSDSLYAVVGEAYSDSTGYTNGAAGLYRLREITIPTVDVIWTNVAPVIGNQMYYAPEHVRFSYTLDSPSDVSICIYSDNGTLLKWEDLGYKEEGNNVAIIRADDIPNGIYLYEVRSETNARYGKMSIVR